jgi:two-component system cell cycle sensor histidine kinase/response regulator CckA
MRSSKERGDASVWKRSGRKVLPVLAAFASVAGGSATLYAQAMHSGRSGSQYTFASSQLPLLLVAVLALVTAGTAVWLVERNLRHSRELQAENRALKQAHARLQQEARDTLQSEQRFRLLFASNPCPMWIINCDTLAISDVNDAALQQYGYTREEFLRLSALDLRPAEEAERLLTMLRNSNQGYGSRGVWIHRRKDGRPLQVEIGAFRFVHGESTRELVLAQDVTARVEAEEALLRSQTALKSMVDNAPFGICSISLQADCFVDFNPALARMLGGCSREEMLALKLSTQVHAERSDRERMLELLRRARCLSAFEATFLRKDGNPIRIRAWGVLRGRLDEEPDLLDAYIEDITEQSSLEQQVRQAQKLEAVARLAGGIAHDFNNILVVIRLSTELMLGKVTLDSPFSKPLLQVLNAADRAAALTRQMLAFGRQQVMQTRTVNLNAVVSDTLQLLRRTIGEDIELVTHFDEGLGNTRLDPDQLAQVIMNLAINSRDAMPHGGTLEIDTRNVDLDPSYASDHGPVQPGKYVMLAVTDSGTGIDSAILPRIFDPFFTTKEVGKGTGLGLSIVYGIVKQSGGYVWVYSEPSHGTTFKLYFPVTDAQPEMPAGRTDFLASPGDKRILVVEDEVEIRQNLCQCLQQFGYQVVQAADGFEAVEVFEDEHGKVDLVVTDLVMPRMGGRELWTKLTRLNPDVNFLFMSGYTQDNALRREMISRQNSFLTKPFSVADLSSALQRAFALQAVRDSEPVATV